MPRGPRLDAPGVLHHVMVRGLDRQVIFREDVDRAEFVARLASLAEAGALVVYAWALLPNHAHLLVRTGTHALARSMRRLLTAYAGAFNRRHRRVGHLFQNRYKSVVVEEEPYLLELVRYLHLNPLRAGVVRDLQGLAEYPWSGHPALLGTVARPWQATGAILAQFGPTLRWARRAYRDFVAAGVAQGRRSELQGGGLRRSVGGWAAVQALRRGREAYLSDERILGTSEFVEQIQQDLAAQHPPGRGAPSLEMLIDRVCRAVGIAPASVSGRGRRPATVTAREGVAYLWVDVCGQSGRALAARVGVQPPAICKAARRGAVDAARWVQLIGAQPKET